MSRPGRKRADIVPNLLTLSRFPLAGAVWLDAAQPVFVLILMAVAGLTDVLDGWFARRIRDRYLREGLSPPNLAHSKAVGAWLDPVADKTFVLSVLLVVLFVYRAPMWQVLVLFAREIVQLPLVVLYVSAPAFKKRLDYDFTAAIVGKATTVAQFLGLAALMMYPAASQPLVIAAGVLGVIAALTYLRRGTRALEEESR